MYKNNNDEHYSPESAFLENEPAISPIDMSHTIPERTHAILEVLSEAHENQKETVVKQMPPQLLWQVTSNLQTLRKVLDTWHEGCVSIKKDGELSASLYCEVQPNRQ